jgi:hypothetical protein
MHGSLSSSKRGDDSPASKPPPARGFCINGVLDPFPCLRYRLRMPDADDKPTPVNLLHHGRRRSTARASSRPARSLNADIARAHFGLTERRSLRLPFSRHPPRLSGLVHGGEATLYL